MVFAISAASDTMTWMEGSLLALAASDMAAAFTMTRSLITAPGDTELARMPNSCHSFAMVRVSAISADLAAP